MFIMILNTYAFTILNLTIFQKLGTYNVTYEIALLSLSQAPRA